MDVRSVDRVVLTAVVVLPLIYFGALISGGITFGDGPELLTAVLLRGVAHPSGYPLFTLLGQPFVHLPWVTPHYGLAFFLSALPGALTSGVIFATLRRLEVHPAVAAPMALSFAFATVVVTQSTRVEVYALHCAFVALTFYAMVRYQQGLEQRWILLTALSLSLGLTNHLTTVFLVIPVVLGLALAGRGRVFRPEVIARVAMIAAACGALYFYLPISARLAEADRIVWNDPQTLARFWFHVTGAEYDMYRSTSDIGQGLRAFVTSTNRNFFPGVLLVLVAAVAVTVRQKYKVVLPLLLSMAALLVYTSTYNVNDIATYYGGIFVAGTLITALGIDRLLRWRPAVLERRWATALVATMLLCGPAAMAFNNRGIRYLHVLAEDMSDDVVAHIPDHTIIFTSVDGHTFPLWYQAYVKHPDRDLVVVDRVLFRLENKGWYRSFLRRRHPDIVWPPDALTFVSGLDGRWEKYLIEHNRDRPVVAMAARRWLVKGTTLVNEGWHQRVIPRGRGDGRPRSTRHGMHIYMAEGTSVGGTTYLHDSRRRYPIATENLACAAEWWTHRDLRTRFIFRGPGGVEHVVGEHPVPAASNLSWDYLKIPWQTPGQWTCEVEVDGEVDLTLPFELVSGSDTGSPGGAKGFFEE